MFDASDEGNNEVGVSMNRQSISEHASSSSRGATGGGVRRRLTAAGALLAGFAFGLAAIFATIAATVDAAGRHAVGRLAPGRPEPVRVGSCALHARSHCVKADLRGAELPHALLANADLRGALLAGANLTGSHLAGTRLAGANAIATTPHAATVLSLADLRRVDLSRAKLDRLIATGAELRNAKLVGAHLEHAVLQDADLRGADLQRADLSKADLHHADLRGADLRDADLQEARLRGADLRGARLRGADLLRATLEGAAISARQTRSARTLCETISASGTPLDRDCSRLGIRSIYRLRPPHSLPKPHGKIVGVKTRRRLPHAGPSLAKPRRGARVAAAGCRPGAGADCVGLDLVSARFPGVQVPESDFYATDFDRADLEGANLEGSFLAVAQFDEANLSHADLAHTTGGLKLETDTGIIFNYANLEGADLEGADLRGAQFEFTNLRGANLRNANLSEANLWGANMQESNLQGAIMEGTQFPRTSLRGADLVGSFILSAQFDEADFTNALIGAYYKEAPGGGFSGELNSLNIDQAGWTCKTTLPNKAVDSNDCEYLAKLFQELLAGIATSLAGFDFGIVSASPVIEAAIRGLTEDATESAGATALKAINWALFDGTPSSLKEIVESSPTLGRLSTEIVPVVKELSVKTGSFLWEVLAPPSTSTASHVQHAIAEALTLRRDTELGGLPLLVWATPYLSYGTEGSQHSYAYNPIEEWLIEWERELYTWWGSKNRGAEYAREMLCPMYYANESPASAYEQCQFTGNPVDPPNMPAIESGGEVSDTEHAIG